MKSIMTENPGASEQRIRRLWLDEVRADKKLRETIADEVATKLFRENKEE